MVFIRVNFVSLLACPRTSLKQLALASSSAVESTISSYFSSLLAALMLDRALMWSYFIVNFVALQSHFASNSVYCLPSNHETLIWSWRCAFCSPWFQSSPPEPELWPVLAYAELPQSSTVAQYSSYLSKPTFCPLSVAPQFASTLLIVWAASPSPPCLASR